MLMVAENHSLDYRSYESPPKQQKSCSKSREICKTEEDFLASDSELLSTEREGEEEEGTESEGSYDEENEVRKIQKNLTDLSLFPEGPPDEFSK
jgi:hypothetical protein